MSSDVRATVEEVFDLTVAPDPLSTGTTALLEALYGIDGVDIGTDEANVALAFPVTMDEGSDGVYSTGVKIFSAGIYWARVSVDGRELTPILVRVATSGFPATDGRADTPITIASVVPNEPTSVEISMFDAEGTQVGFDSDSLPIAWPEAMSQVPGRADSWFFGPLTFSEGGRIQVKVAPTPGPIRSDVLVIDALASTIVLTHFDGWEPDAALVPSDWATVGYIRRWIGWSSSEVNDQDLKELRRTAIETFIRETNMWVPSWSGTWHGLRAQGSLLFLPVPILLPRDGGIEPVVQYVRPEGDKDDVETLSNDNLIWRVRGRHAKQPTVENVDRWWDHTLDVRITATWGTSNVDMTGIPIALKQVIVGLIRWHSLSFGVGPDDSRDQATLNRITTEATRDARVTVSDKAVGDGLTGDRTIDRLIAEMTIPPGPWVRRGGDQPPEAGRLDRRRRSL